MKTLAAHCTCWRWLLPALAILSAQSVFGHGIIHVQMPPTLRSTNGLPPDTMPVTFPEDALGTYVAEPLPIIINGQTVCTFYPAFSVAASSASGIISLQPFPDFPENVWVVPLSAGQEIGPGAAGYSWLGGGLLSSSIASGSIEDPILTAGLFAGVESAYFGFNFRENDETYYGWMRVGSPYALPTGTLGWVYDYAYETRPNTPILAGAVPEPSPSTIAYFDGPAFQIPAPSGIRSIDLNRDGTPDFTFSSDSIICTADVPPSACVWPFHIAAMGTNQLLASGAALTQPAGLIIANGPPSGATWVSPGATVRLTSYLSGHNRGVPYAEWTDSLGALAEGYLAVRFYAAGGLHYGWIHVRLPNQEAGTNGFLLELTPVVLDWAYETRPNTPIRAGALVPDVKFTATFSGGNEIPRNQSSHFGTGTFTLSSNTLSYVLGLDFDFRPASAKILGPALTTSNSRHLIADLGSYTILEPDLPSLVTFSGFFPRLSPMPAMGPVRYIGQVTLNERQVRQLSAGRLYGSFTSTNYPRGELRGAILPAAPISFAANLSGTNEVPRNASTHCGSVQFTLTGARLDYTFAAETNFVWSLAGIFGPAGPRAHSTNLIAALDTSLGTQSGAQVLYTGSVDLNDRDILRLKRGRLFVNVLTTQFPRGELRGQIAAQDSNTNGVPDFVDAYVEEFSPCNGSWKNRAQYVRAVKRSVLELAAARLITGPQFRRILRQAHRSDCGKNL